MYTIPLMANNAYYNSNETELINECILIKIPCQIKMHHCFIN